MPRLSIVLASMIAATPLLMAGCGDIGMTTASNPQTAPDGRARDTSKTGELITPDTRIDTSKVDTDLGRVIDRCSQTPDMTVVDAFRRTSSTPVHWLWEMP